MCVCFQIGFPRVLITRPCVLIFILAPGPQVQLGQAALCPQAGCLGNAPLLGTSIRKCHTVFGGSDLVPSLLSPSPFSIPVTSAQVANSLVSMGTQEGCLSFSVPNICLYKQLYAAPPPSRPEFGLGEEVLCLSRGVGFLAPLGLASVGWLQPWTLGAPGRRVAGARGAPGAPPRPAPGGRGGCSAQSCVRSTWALLCCPVALDRLSNLSLASVSSSGKWGC